MRSPRIRIQVRNDITLCKKIQTLLNVYTGREGEKQKTPNNGDEKYSQTVETLNKLLRVSTKSMKNGKEILISKEKSASIIRRYKTKLRMVRNLVKPKLAQKKNQN